MDSGKLTAGPPTILIVEDEYVVALEIQAVLEDAGYVVAGPVVTVAAALAEIARQLPNACVLE